ncbi:MAG: hypothetical protein U0842_22655 [Candidatus Binatia bacterium]
MGDLPQRRGWIMWSVPLSRPPSSATLMPMIALDTLAYARRLRQAGFSEEQAEAQAEALAAVMVESLATKPDLQEMDLRMDTRFARLGEQFARIDERFARVDERFARVDDRFARVDERFEHLERKMDMRFSEQEARFDAKLSDLERRLTMRLGGMMMAGIGAVSALVKLI